MEKKMNETKEGIEKKMNENKEEIQKSMISTKILSWRGFLKGMWRPKEIMNVMRIMLLRIKFIWGVFNRNWKTQILNHKIIHMNFQSKIHIMRASS